MPTPRRESDLGPTPASAYVLERKLLRVYEALYQQQVASIWHPATRKAKAVQLLGGQLAATQVRYAEQRLREGMPELIQRLTLAQQPQLEALLLTAEPDLAQVVALLVKLERNLNYREDDARLALDDDARLKAASMGHLSRQQYELTKPKYARLGESLVLTPWPPRLALRTSRKPPRRVVPVLRGQLSLWPPRELAGGGGGEAGL